jgi:hypothetical protein
MKPKHLTIIIVAVLTVLGVVASLYFGGERQAGGPRSRRAEPVPAPKLGPTERSPVADDAKADPGGARPVGLPASPPETVPEAKHVFGSGDSPSVLLELVDPEQQPVPGVRVHQPDGAADVLDPVPISVSDEAGLAQVHLTWSGHDLARVYLEAAGWAPEEVLLSRTVPKRRVGLRPGGVLRGRVVDPEGQPVPDAVICARPRHAAHWESVWGRVESRSDSRGAFDLRDLALDGLHLEVRSRGFVPLQRVVRGEEYRGEIEVVLVRGRELVLRVRDRSGRPLLDVEVRTTATWERKSRMADLVPARSNSGGIVRVTGIPEGVDSLRLIISAPGYSDLIRDLEGEELTVAVVDVVLDALATLVRGKVVDAEGNALSGVVTVQFRPEGSDELNAVFSTPTDADGNFVVRRLQAGVDFRLGFNWRPPRSATQVGPLVESPLLRLGDGEEIDVRLEPPALSRVTIRCEGAGGVPAPGVSVSSVPAAVTGTEGLVLFVASGVTGPGGLLRFLLPAGKYKLEARRGEWLVAELAAVVEKEHEELVVLIESGGQVSGVVRDHSGRPLAHVVVRVFSRDFGFEAMTGEDGEFLFAALPLRPLTLQVTGPRGEPNGLRLDGVQPGGAPLILILSISSLRGRLVDSASQQPLAGKVLCRKAVPGLAATPVVGSLEEWVETDENANFEVAQLSAGEWVLEGRVPGYLSTERRVLVPTEETVTLPLPKGAYFCFVSFPHENPSGVTIQVRAPGAASAAAEYFWFPEDSKSPAFGPLKPGPSVFEVVTATGKRRTQRDLGAGRVEEIDWLSPGWED